MKKKPQDATVEEILSDVTYYEDIDSALVVASTKDGGVFIMEYDGNAQISASTFKDALIKLQKESFKKYPWMIEDSKEYDKLDWSDYYE